MNHSAFLQAAATCGLTLGIAATGLAVAAPAGQMHHEMKMTPQQAKMQRMKTMKMMKKMDYKPCYGVNAAYKNDCQSPGHSCAGQDSKARDPQAFVAMPAGLCTKIAGGSLTKGA